MPKMYKHGFKEKITYENMYKAYLNARKKKRYRKDVILFNLRYEERLLVMCEKSISDILCKLKSTMIFRYYN